MKSSTQFKLSKRIRLAGKLFGYNTAFSIFGDKKLGQGAFGTVYSSKGNAVKVSHSRGLPSLENEIQMLQETSGIGVAPKLLGSGKGFATMQKFEGKPLSEWLKKIKNDPVFADYIFRKIVEAIGALHRKNIAQRDLHAGNIFITNDYQVKILDYGQARKGYAITFFETFFGNNNDPTEGSLGLIAHLFTDTNSYKVYKKILINAIKVICKKKGVDFNIILRGYEAIEGDDKKEREYFDNLEIIAHHVENDYTDVGNFYSALDKTLKINTKNPKKIRTIVPKTSIASKTSGIASSINKKYSFKGTIPQASEGGVFSGPESGYPIILHGTEAVIPLDDINVPAARYIQGQSGVWELDFESILDHAIYFAGKSPFPKGAKQAEILDWLQDTLGLTYKEISEHREKILDKIRELTPGAWEGGNYPYLKIPRIDPKFEMEVYMGSETSVYKPGEKFVDDQKEIFDNIIHKAEDALEETSDGIMDAIDELLRKDQEKLEKFKEEEAKRLEERIKKIYETDAQDDENEEEPEGLDELLNDIAQEKTTEEINEDVLDDLPEGLREALANHINKKTGREVIPQQEKTNKSSSVSNSKIYKFLTTGITQIQNKLNSIDASLQEQNNLLRNSIELSFKAIERVEEQDQILANKIDALTDAYLNQNHLAKEVYDKQEFKRNETALERSRKVSGLETPIDTRNLNNSSNGSGFISKLRKFFKTNVGKFLWRLIEKHIPARLKSVLFGINKIAKLPSKIASKISRSIINKASQRLAPKVATTVARTGVVKGWEHIALPGVEKSVASSVDKPIAKAFSTQTDNILIKILKSRKVQEALVKKLGKEGAEKLSVKLAGKLIPGISTVYGLGEGLARMAMGDIKGGFLSFGSAIPVAGWGFAAIDVLRDLDTTAYTKHIESNLSDITTGNGNEHIAAFFADALGIKEGDYEVGGLTKPGISMLHGTEAVIPKNRTTPVDPIGGILLSATLNYMKNAGPEASSIAPMIKQVASPLTKIYDVPNVVVTTPVGGNMSGLSSTFKQFKTKTSTDELSLEEKDLMNTPNETIFSEMLYKMIDPEGKFLKIIDDIKTKFLNFRNPLLPPGPPGQVGAEPFVLLGGSQDPGQAGIDFTLKGTQNRAIFAGTVVEIDHQYNPNVTGGDNRKGAGYGNYVVIRSTNPVDGSQVDMLYAHFPQGEIKVNQGDQVSVGQDLGRMATEQEFADPRTRPQVGSGTGAHTSLDFFKPGSHQAHSKAREIGDYILKELRKGPQGEIEKTRQQAYQAQQTTANKSLPTAKGLGKQGVVSNQDFGQTSGVGNKGYLIVPGHASGGGAPEEKSLVRMLAKNAYDNLKSKYPSANIQYMDPDSMFTDDDSGWNKQKDWYKQKEKEGWEILEVHMDASIESGEGKGRGVITSKSEMNPVEAYFAKNYGAYDRGFRDLALSNRGGGIFELGNMSPELQKNVKSNKVSADQLNALTAPLERSIAVGLNLHPPSQKTKFQTLQGPDKKEDTKFLIINQASAPTINGSTSTSFESIGDGSWRSTTELNSSARNLLMLRLGAN
jgi:hypothetical protein